MLCVLFFDAMYVSLYSRFVMLPLIGWNDNENENWEWDWDWDCDSASLQCIQGSQVTQ